MAERTLSVQNGGTYPQCRTSQTLRLYSVRKQGTVLHLSKKKIPPFPNQRYPRSRKRENTRHCPCVFANAFNVLLTQKVIPQLRVLFRPPAVGLHGIVPAGVLRAERTALETVWE